MKTIFENNGGAYMQAGDYLLPNLSLSAEEKEMNICVWAMRHKRYLKQNHKVRYYNLLTSGQQILIKHFLVLFQISFVPHFPNTDINFFLLRR